MGDGFGADEALGDGEAGGGEAAEKQAAGGGGDDGPAIGWEGAEEGFDAREDGEVGGVGELKIFDRAQAGVGVDVRAEIADDVDGSAAVGEQLSQ